MLSEISSMILSKAFSCIKDKTAWCLMGVGLMIGVCVGYWLCDNIVARHSISVAESRAAIAAGKEQEAVSAMKGLRADNTLLKNDKERMLSQISDLTETINQLRENDLESPSMDSAVINSLSATNRELVSRLEGANIEIIENKKKLMDLREALDRLRKLYSQVPVSCTNIALLAFVYDYDNKLLLRNSAIEKETLRLSKIRDQMLDLVHKAYTIQLGIAESKAQPIKSVKELENAYVNVFLRLGSAVSAFRTINDLHLHFLSHVYGNADKKLADNLLEPTQIFEIKLEADFKSVENARLLLDRMLQLNIDDETFFTKTIDILVSHLRTCGKKSDEKK